ncbi:MAG: hypothetical protein ABSE57_19675 [Bryobacteraceae bacterium]
MRSASGGTHSMAPFAAFRASGLNSDPSALFLVTCVSTSAIFPSEILSRSISITGMPVSSTMACEAATPARTSKMSSR